MDLNGFSIPSFSPSLPDKIVSMRSFRLIVALALVAISMASLVYNLSYFIYLFPGQNSYKVQWTELAPTPGAENDYRPQGIEAIAGSLYLAISEADERTTVYQYPIQNLEAAPTQAFVMPDTANHTSGFSLHEGSLWAADFYNNVIYKMSVENDFSVEWQSEAELSSLSTIAVFRHRERDYLVATEFRSRRSTFIYDLETLEETGSLAESELMQVRNGGFNQGIYYSGGVLLEAANHIGIDKIRALDFDALLDGSSYSDAIKCVFDAPADMVEDLTIADGFLYTSDESTFRLYRAPVADLCF